MDYRGRFAPSPSGRLHQGSLIAGYASYLRALSENGSYVLRIEDLDFPRCPASNTPVILEELELLGIKSKEDIIVQSRNLSRYDEVLNNLLRGGIAYYCQCSRAEIKERPCPCASLNLKPANCDTNTCHTHSHDPRIHDHSACKDGKCDSAKCDGSTVGSDSGAGDCSSGGTGGSCNGTTGSAAKSCCDDSGHEAPRKQLAIRINLEKLLSEFASFVDGNLGEIVQAQYSENLSSSLVLKRADDIIAYNLACVVDDHDEGITEVVRGADMLDATFVQLCLYKVLGYEPPRFLHVPLIVDHNGNKLSKQNKAPSVLASMLPHEALLHTCRMLGQKITVKATEQANEIASFAQLFTNQLTNRYAQVEGAKLLTGTLELSPAAITNGIMSLSYQCLDKKIDSHRLYEQLHSSDAQAAELSEHPVCVAPSHCTGTKFNAPCALGCHGRNELSALAQPSSLGRALGVHLTERELTKVLYAADSYRSAMNELIESIGKSFTLSTMPKQSIVI